MFRREWNEFEKTISDFASEMREFVEEKFNFSKQEYEKAVNMTPDERKQAFIQWGRKYVEKVKSKSNTERVSRAKDSFFSLLRNLGVNEAFVKETFKANSKEVLDPLVGETIAIIALVLGWSPKDKELFSQAIGEIGVAGVFAAKPFLCLIALCGLAYGYQDNFHQESFKKGGVLGLAGLTAMALSPGGFVGILAAIVAILYFNKKLKVDRPIETQLKEIIQQIKSGEFFKEVRKAWSDFEKFLGQLFSKNEDPDVTRLSEA